MTKRVILSILSSLYDPLGFASPVILIPKLLLQDLCRAGFGRDKELTPDYISRWRNWINSLADLNEFRIPRCHKPPDFGTVIFVKIHNFADSSAEAYGICSYLRLTNEEAKVHFNLLFGKCRLAPLKTLSIPRLELTAAVLAVRLDILLRKELKFDNCTSTFWTDSTAVIQTIRNYTKRFLVFVANQILIIESNTKISDWRHVSSKFNPADLATCRCTTKALLSSEYQ